jgi:hypothetical protein
MAEDLVRERRRVLELRRENRRLRAELERLRNTLGPRDQTGSGERVPQAPRGDTGAGCDDF